MATLNRTLSRHCLERVAGRAVEVMWLKGRLVPDRKTIADFRRGFEGSEVDPGDRFP